MRRVVRLVDGYPKVGHEVILSSGEIISLLIGGGYTCCETIGTELILPEKYTGDLADEQEILGTVVKARPRWATNSEIRAAGGEPAEDYGGEARVIIETEKGRLWLRVWNHHNGYYPHSVTASWNGYRDTQSI